MHDEIDLLLMEQLQVNAEISHADLGKLCGLSAAGVFKRLGRLRQQGVLTGTVAVLDREKLGLDLVCFLQVSFKDNMRAANIGEFREAVQALPEVLEAYSITGSSDALLKVLVPNHTVLRDFLRRLAEAQNVIGRIETCIVLEEFKETHKLPLRSR
jgi:DNA-binding Lrp family transcriptional regulator